MSNKVKWGVIGCGGIAARRTIPELKKLAANAELVSVMDTNAARAREVAAQFGVPHACATEAELLAQDVQAVYIASPPNAHCRQTVQAARAGKHILCEKPIAVSVAEVDHQDSWQLCTLGIACVSGETSQVQQLMRLTKAPSVQMRFGQMQVELHRQGV